MHPLHAGKIITNPWPLPMLYNCALFLGSKLLNEYSKIVVWVVCNCTKKSIKSNKIFNGSGQKQLLLSDSHSQKKKSRRSKSIFALSKIVSSQQKTVSLSLSLSFFLFLDLSLLQAFMFPFQERRDKSNSFSIVFTKRFKLSIPVFFNTVTFWKMIQPWWRSVLIRHFLIQ